MKNKILNLVIIGVTLFSLAGCGSKDNNAKDVIVDLNKLHKDCMKENDGSVCNMNFRLQEYLESYSNYKLLNSSQNEFESKPQNAKSLYSYGSSRDGVCAYKYVLIYDSENKNYYSVELECENNDSSPIFKNAKLLK